MYRIKEEMNYRKLTHKQRRIFDSYTTLDVPIVREASRCGCALLGGTAVQMLARFYHVKERRSRSIDDLDFLTPASNREGISAFKHKLITNGFEPIKMGESDYMLNYENKEVGVEVDVLISWEPGIEEHFIKVNGILTVEPCYMFVSKLQRIFSGLSTKNELDTQDINTLYDIIESRDEIEKLQDMIADEIPEVDEDELNALLQETN